MDTTINNINTNANKVDNAVDNAGIKKIGKSLYNGIIIENNNILFSFSTKKSKDSKETIIINANISFDKEKDFNTIIDYATRGIKVSIQSAIRTLPDNEFLALSNQVFVANIKDLKDSLPTIVDNESELKKFVSAITGKKIKDISKEDCDMYRTQFEELRKNSK